MAASQRSTERRASRCTPVTARATLVFEIVGYSLHKGMGVGKFIRSTTVSVGGHQWCIRYYPDGTDTHANSQGHVSVYLELLNKGAKVRVLFDLMLINHVSGLASSVFAVLKSPVVFDPHNTSGIGTSYTWGTPSFKKKSELEELPYLRDDRLVIECDLTVIKEPLVATTAITAEVQIPPSDLAENFEKLLEVAEEADVTFEVEGEIFPAHKIVLAARSPVFKAELYGLMRGKCGQNITIEDMEPTVFKALLHFIYTDLLPSMGKLDDEEKKEMVRHLLVAAERYAMERMKMMCEDILCKTLDVQTVATTSALADQHHCSRLKDACAEFIMSSNRLDDVLASQGYVHPKKSCPVVSVNILESIMKLLKF
ncbi:BTB/POZ and MATH domain-containing protein 2-like [Triticum dicoccoides]|uniref:BTB/POZ and MATH domain-containing protein 2-like n=1 Tax=Triticum dicoccoides TaxID=85692 RepID=UPI000E7890A1|nr:BTB/POZ and MATH domain-containing protein 2-like [Triticum dicoccoides]